VLEDDDEVAVLHGPEELGYPPLTEAMVNIRATLAEATRCGILAPDLAAHLTGIAKSLFYKDRTYDGVLKRAGVSGVPAGPLQALAVWLPSDRVDQKQIEAEALLAAIRAHLAATQPPLRIKYNFANTVTWQAGQS